MTRFNASRNSVREALRALQALGIVDIRHGYGTFVGQASLDILHTSIVFRAGLAGEQLRIMSNLVDLREVLESGFIDTVIDNISAVDLDRLDAIVARMDHDDQVAAADKEFHELLYRSCDNQLLLELIRVFWNVYQTVEPLLEQPDESTHSISEVHGAIVDRVRAHDYDGAREAVRAHFHDVRERIDSSPDRSLA